MNRPDRQLFAFVDLKDPFVPIGIEGEQRPGPVLSIFGAFSFARAFLFHTPHTRREVEETAAAVRRRYPQCKVMQFELPVADPKNYSQLLGALARIVREIRRQFPWADSYICVSSGTAEMRAAWFLLNATAVLPGKLLQVGTPAAPLFGARHVTEIQLDRAGWDALRDLIMPMEYFRQRTPADAEPAVRMGLAWDARTETSGVAFPAPKPAFLPAPAPVAYLELDEALAELEIFIASAVMRRAAEKAAVIAPTPFPVLLLGETGTGKELFARLVHRLSDRRTRVFTSVNCAALPRELAESLLFGYSKGAFTGAFADRKGKFEAAEGGTLFLDEIGELAPEVQAKLLRALETGEIERLGAAQARKVDVRVIAATNRKLDVEIQEGRFRQDLYYRLETGRIDLPPLRERTSEIAPLALRLLERINNSLNRQRQLSREALARLEQHGWPGNVRELKNVLERSVLYCAREVLEPHDILIHELASKPDRFSALPEPGPGFLLEEFLAKAREHLILRALDKCNGKQSAAAALLGVSKQAVQKFVSSRIGNAR